MSEKVDVLVIDDNEAIAEIVCAAMSTLQLTCRRVVRASEFMEAVEDEPGWIIMDMKMPDMDGPELLALLARHGSTARIVLMSGSAQHALDEVAKEARRLGLHVAGVLVKPFRVPQLLAMVNQDG